MDWKMFLKKKGFINRAQTGALLVSLWTIVTACGVLVRKQNPIDPQLAAVLASPGAVISYSEVNQGVFTPSCISCHNSNSASAGVMLDTYDHVMSSLNAVKSVAVDRQTMPPSGPLQSDQITLLSTWIDQGAPNTASPSPTATPAPMPNPDPAPTATPEPTPIPTPAGGSVPNPTDHRHPHRRPHHCHRPHQENHP